MPRKPVPKMLPSSIEEINKLAHVLIYTIPRCPYCIRAVRYLDQDGVDYIEVVVDYGKELHLKLQQIVHKTSLPQIFVGGTHIGGCDDMMSMDKGRLKQMLHP